MAVPTLADLQEQYRLLFLQQQEGLAETSRRNAEILAGAVKEMQEAICGRTGTNLTTEDTILLACINAHPKLKVAVQALVKGWAAPAVATGGKL